MEAIEKMPDIRDLRLFDSCVTLGRIVHSSYPEDFPTAANLIKMMDRYGIADALVHDHHARLIYPRADGNRRLLEEIKDQPRLHPVWVIEPPKKPGADAARALVSEMLEAGVRAARLPMKRIPPLAWLWDDLCSALEEHRVPCFLDFGDVSTLGDMRDGDVNGAREIALAHPQLPMVLSHVMGGLGVHPAIVPMIRRTENIYIDICGILEYWREVAWEISPERVLFSTGAPFFDPGLSVANVQYARRLDEEAKGHISGGNLRRLLGAVR